MFSISPNGIIQMSRGDTWSAQLFINTGTELEPVPYDLVEGDALYFGVMEPNSSFENAIICKKLTSEDKAPGSPAIPDRPLLWNQPAKEGVQYYTRAVSQEKAGYLNDGTYAYTPVQVVPAEHPSDMYYPLLDTGMDYPGYYEVKFTHKDTAHLVPGVYYYQTKLAKWEEKEWDYKVDTIVSKTKFIIVD